MAAPVFIRPVFPAAGLYVKDGLPVFLRPNLNDTGGVMILLDEPYVSDLLQTTVAAENLPVVDSLAAAKFAPNARTIAAHEVGTALRSGKARLYSNSENAIGWICENLGATDLPRQIDLFKDKVAFRRLLEPLYPDFFYREIAFENLDQVAAADFSYPVIIKPAVGFFSMGVHRVESQESWPAVIAAIREEMRAARGIYPEVVMDGSRFIVEACIPGEETSAKGQ